MMKGPLGVMEVSSKYGGHRKCRYAEGDFPPIMRFHPDELIYRLYVLSQARDATLLAEQSQAKITR